MTGPLQGIKIVEFAGIGPAPFCAMMLADMGAEVIRIDRKSFDGWSGSGVKALEQGRKSVINRGRRSVALDLKIPEGRDAALRLLGKADALIEGFRPGVMEKLGLGPEKCLSINPGLVYGRMTGWGQDGPLALAAGHDINYIALSGALYHMGPPEGEPCPPLNLVGDFGGGGLLLAYGIICGILSSRSTGKGQIVDSSMVDGSALLMSTFYGLKAAGQWSSARGGNFLDGSAPFYSVYKCADGKFIAIGPIEPGFFSALIARMGLDESDFDGRMDVERWPGLKDRLASVFKTATRDEWCDRLKGTDACFAPVLNLDEAPLHPHNLARKTFIELDGLLQPSPAPRFSVTSPGVKLPPPLPGEHTEAVLRDWGFPDSDIDDLRLSRAI